MTTQVNEIGELPEIATTAEVAAYTKTSIPTLNRWRAEGKGPKPRYFGRSVRYRREDVLAWIEAATVPEAS